jgi:hypothetical protein
MCGEGTFSVLKMAVALISLNPRETTPENYRCAFRNFLL